MKYLAPEIPVTPSSKINHQLQMRFGHPPDNLIKSLVAHYICAVFYSMNLLYDSLLRANYFSNNSPTNGNKNDNRTLDGPYKAWLVACTLVPMMLVLSCFLLYKVIIASSFLAETVLAYGLASFAWVALAAGICGALFYDRNQSKKINGRANNLNGNEKDFDQKSNLKIQ